MNAPPEHTNEVLCVGLTTLDVVHRAPAPPTRNTKVTATRQDVAAGGPAANAAVVATALGSAATLLTALGHSAIAAAARADLDTWGVGVVDADPGHQVAVSAIVVDDDGGRSVTSLDAGHTDPQWPGPPDRRPAVVLIDGHFPSLARAAARYARECGALVILDAGRWREVFVELLPMADIAAASADFVLPDGGRGPRDLVRAGARVGVVTHGAQPLRFATAETSGQVPVPQVPVRDTLGAGDAFHGALAASLARQPPAPAGSVPATADLTAVLGEAVAVAAHRVQHIGPRDFLHGLRPRR